MTAPLGGAAVSTQSVDFSPDRKAFLADVLAGLGNEPKQLSAKYFYDTRGSELFEEITTLDEYYQTRTEIRILEAHAREIAALAGPSVVLIEPGAGAVRKVRILLDVLDEPAAFVPVDISGEHLLAAAGQLSADYPSLPILPVVADYMRPFDLKLPTDLSGAKRVVFFPGSTIGNLDRPDAQGFLQRMAQLVGRGGGAIVGVDLKKDRARLEAAYDDDRGVTAAFNMNLLVRMNAELGADFDLAGFRHRALWNADEGRVEMHLESVLPQNVTIDGRTLAFRRGETIHTENSYKFDVPEFQELASAAGFRARTAWTDDEALFSVHFLQAA